MYFMKNVLTCENPDDFNDWDYFYCVAVWRYKTEQQQQNK